LTSRERRGARSSARRRASFRPALAALEDRRLLSTLTVTSSLDNGGLPGDGTLRGEIAAAALFGDDTIVFDPSLDGQTITLASGELYINKSLTIQGPGAGLLAISGGGYWRVFEVGIGVMNDTISGLTIENGDGTDRTGGGMSEGGGILNDGTLTVSACTVTGNITGYMWNGSSSVPAGQGGGIANLSGGTMTLTGCTVTNNSAGLQGPGGPTTNAGGGIYNDGRMTLSGSTVTGNTAQTGGGIFNDFSGHLTILSSVVKNNQPKKGYDIFNLGWMSISKDSTVGKVYG
jgi:hypothetical protein